MKIRLISPLGTALRIRKIANSCMGTSNAHSRAPLFNSLSLC